MATSAQRFIKTTTGSSYITLIQGQSKRVKFTLVLGIARRPLAAVSTWGVLKLFTFAIAPVSMD